MLVTLILAVFADDRFDEDGDLNWVAVVGSRVG
jgi:hypothetical protein